MRLARENDADPLIQRGFVVTKRTLLCQAISHRSASLLRASRIVSASTEHRLRNVFESRAYCFEHRFRITDASVSNRWRITDESLAQRFVHQKESNVPRHKKNFSGSLTWAGLQLVQWMRRAMRNSPLRYWRHRCPARRHAAIRLTSFRNQVST